MQQEERQLDLTDVIYSVSAPKKAESGGVDEIRFALKNAAKSALGRDETWPEKFGELRTPEDFLSWFREIGIPGYKWKSCDWLKIKAKLPVERGGVGFTLSSLANMILARFGGHPNFVAWMDLKESGVPGWKNAKLLMIF